MPKTYNWSAKSNKVEGVQANMSYEGPATAAEAIEMSGDAVVLSNYIGNIRVTAQGAMRRMIEKGLNPTEIGERMKAWAPGVALSRDIDPEQAFLVKYRGADKKEKARMLELLKAEG